MKRLLVIAACLGVSACAASTRESEWRCQPQSGMGCVTVAQADGKDPLPTSTDDGSGDRDDRYKEWMGAQAVASPAGRGVGGFIGPSPDLDFSGGAGRVPEKIARIWFAPRIDKAGNLLEGHYVRSVVSPARWDR
ncbi:TraV family lipoprotein [Nitrospirillum amazonense]|uniref:TraV family lipoprotein n=1 Tax=Nitrospirillum amazonense TaxID=28077 RepID=UPI002412B833|nr:TraV family lipoprotein [Nitrospirillum amazonense]MDG3444536.1 TraV family lipoprotein [Nitrospirillum amazonense]